jgi:hypothetical protein
MLNQMRKLLPIFTIVFLFICQNSYSQVREIIDAIKPAKAYEGTPILLKGSHVIQIGVGAPNNVGTLLNTASAVSSAIGTIGGILGIGGTSSVPVEKAIKKSGPFVLDYEYFVKDNISIGLGVSYANASKEFTLPGETRTLTTKLAATSFLFSSVYHFYTTNKLDPYAKGSIGLTLWKDKSTYSDGADASSKFPIPIPTPVAYRGIIGLRYFVSSTIAPYGELSYSNLRFSGGIGVAVKLR